MTAASDGLWVNEDVWDLLGNLVEAAHSRDHAKYLSALRPFGQATAFEDQQLTILYAHFLLRGRVATLLGHMPSADELGQLAEPHVSDYETLLPGKAKLTVDETLRKVFKVGPQPPEAKRGVYDIAIITVLGLLLNEPRADLQEMRPRLAEWCRLDADSFDEIRRDAVATRERSERVPPSG